jgi:hypothetical protein
MGIRGGFPTPMGIRGGFEKARYLEVDFFLKRWIQILHSNSEQFRETGMNKTVQWTGWLARHSECPS